ncbi:uncharacterized protein FPRO_13776 [Fusarium proliferatum ET1]|uniref:Related to integral membrane protein PTH11 n=1 Tax=Fusarium proliferatum (strain ET1) TaxID=1227346 RepID=A0A1L7VUA0_FUSPR|nr:uncharacterized protein FPRO_13776 [Fusarium proliferatum ET1]CZR43968.1 related to integral membrane protein PTH11 [Fusarium proliferatum ET1]
MMVLSIVFLFLTAIVIILRCFVRLKHAIFGVDDSLMLAGWHDIRDINITWLLHVAHVAVSIRAIYAGLGRKDATLNSYQQRSILKYTWIGELIYIFSLICLKCSICITFLRIAVKRLHRMIIWGTIVFIIGTLFFAVVGMFAVCLPISDNWENYNACSPPLRTSTGYVLAISAIVSDWICSVLPFFMLYKSNMQKATKISVSIILGLAVFASIFTIIRIPYYKGLTTPENFFYNLAYIYLWSMVETSVGTIAGSLHAIRKLFSSHFRFDSTTGSSTTCATPFSGTNRATITTQSVASGERSNNWERLDDNEGSLGQKIHVQVDVEMHSSKRPQTPQDSDGSYTDLVRLSRG